MNNKLEKAIDGEYSLPIKIKEDLYSNKLDKLLKQADKLLEDRWWKLYIRLNLKDQKVVKASPIKIQKQNYN